MLSAECRRRTADQKVSRGYGFAFAVLIVSVAAVFWHHLFTSDVLFFRDVTFTHFPRVVEMRALVRSGLLPLWNPFEHFGESVIVNPNYLLFYPTTWLTWVLPAAYGFKLHFVLHFFLAAAGAFLLARRIGLKPFPCYVAGALFVFSGPVMSLGNFYNVLPATAWMPLAVLAADYQMRRGGWRGAGLVATCLALQVFAGSPLISLVTIALVLGWAIAFYGDFAASFWAAANRRLFGRFLWGLMLAGGLAAVQVVPTLWHLRHTQRAGHFTYQHSLFWSLHPLKFVEMLSPQFWGDPFLDEGLPWLYLEGRELYLFPSVFIGLVPLALAMVAVLVRRGTGSEAATDGIRATHLWLVVGMVSLALALGRFTPFGLVFYDLIPLFRIFRFPVKFLVPFTLAATQLAALGVQYLLNGRTEGAHARWLRRLSVGLLALGLLWLVLATIPVFWPGPARAVAGWLTELKFDHSHALHIRQTLGMDRTELLARATDWLVRVIPARLPGVLGVALLMACVLSGRLRESLRRRLVLVVATAGIVHLVSGHHTLNPLADRRLFEDTPPAMRYLEPTHSPSSVSAVQAPPRVLVESSYMPRGEVLADVAAVDFLPPAAQGLYTSRFSLQAATGLLGVENTFTHDPERILPRPQQSLIHRVYWQGLSGEPLVRLLRLGSVDYALLKGLPSAAGLEWIGSAPNATTLPVRVYRVRDALPRAYLVREPIFLARGQPTIARLLSPDHDPARQVVLEPSDPERAHVAEPVGQAGPALQPSGEARLLRRDALHVEVAATTSVPAYLVLTDSYHPDWQVTVNGKPAPLLRANQMFRAVALPPGTHRVVFRYGPLSLQWGAAVTLMTALAIGLFAWRRPGRRNIPGEAASGKGQENSR